MSVHHPKDLHLNYVDGLEKCPSNLLYVNIAVAVEAIQAIRNLARGLRSHFSGNSRFLLPVLLEKLREKKPTSVEAFTQTLQAMHKSGCLNLVDAIILKVHKEYVPICMESLKGCGLLCFGSTCEDYVSDGWHETLGEVP
ncbi:non-motor microtubule binding protein [Lithospermum erythrorhizon]|uniref:Non-motor microtubule binding protein n=1 Tax=Lithospermum erythrorhizon TaxID=34254 RepID=A0AAV3PBG7_LITER